VEVLKYFTLLKGKKKKRSC